MQDEGFHEIQLSGKQLVFLFMAATVVSVVIFLCGVLVGRGVRAERGSALAEASFSAASPEEASQQPVATAAPAESDPTAALPPAVDDNLSYVDRLENQTPPLEELKQAPPGAADPAPAEQPPPVAARAAEPQVPTAGAASTPAVPAPATKSATLTPAAGSGWTVQVAALTVRDDADAIAKRLSSKGYSAYVLEPADGAPTVYRVKVGKFPTRREAEAVAARLQKEEQIKPWVTR